METMIQTRANDFWTAGAGWVAVIIMLLWITPSIAQEVKDSGSVDKQAAVLSDMVVTGEKMDRSIQDTSSSVKVFDSKSIESLANATQISDLLRLTPNIVEVGNGNDLPTVRGTDASGPGRGAVAFVTGTRPRLNVSLDGRALTYNELAFGPQSLWDVDQTEIFLGPQSYVQGRNAIAGSVILTTKDPVFEWEGAAKAALGEQSFSQTAAMVSGPLIKDELALRLSFDRQRRESFVKLEPYSEAGDPSQIEINTYRAKLLYLPSGLQSLLTRLTLAHYDTRAPQSEAYAPDESTGSKFSGSRPVFETESSSAIWDVEWTLGDSIVFENKLVYTDFSNERITEVSDAYADIDGDEFHVEPLIRFGDEKQKLRGLAGLRYFHSSQDEFVNLFNGSNFDDETETASAFGELTYALSPKIDVTFGGRYEHEQRSRQGGGEGVTYGTTTYNVDIDFDETYTAFLPKFEIAWKINDIATVGAKASRGYRAGGAGVTFAVPWTSFAFDEEYVWNYELYSRHRLFDGQVELVSNLFFNEYEDMQLPYYLNTSAVTIINADEVETYGAEVSARWLATEHLELSAGLGLLQTEIKRFSVDSYVGNELPRSPGYSASLGAFYQLGKFELSGDVSYFGDYYSYYDNNGLGRIDEYWVADAQVAYNFERARITVFANNLFDDDSTIMITDNDTDAPLIQQPRLIGVSLDVRF